MRVLFATGIFPPDIGGPATYVSRLADDLSRRGVEARVVTYGANNQTSTTVPVRHVSRDSPLVLRYALYLAGVYRETLDADVIYLQDPLSSGLPGWLGARLARKPVLLKVVGDAAWEVSVVRGLVDDDFVTFQKSVYGSRVELIRRAQRLVARRADGVIVPSRFLGGVVTNWGVPEGRVEIVPNSLPQTDRSPLYRLQARNRLGWNDHTVVFSASRLVPWKGFDTLIRLAGQLKDELPEVRWVIAGSGPCEATLRRLVTQVGANSMVELVGALGREEMAQHMEGSDIFVLWSGYEGLSHMLLEAMRAGRAIIASDSGGNPELIENGRNGVLVPWGQTQELGRAISELCRNVLERERLEREATAASARFTWSTMVQSTLEVLQRLAANRNTPVPNRY